MIKLRTIIILFVVYVVAYLSIALNINLLYPYYLLKDFFLYPVRALTINEALNLSPDLENSIIDTLKKDIEELKELSGIETVLSEFKIINVSVIERNRVYWFNSLTIDKGKKHGIYEDMAVVNKDGLIGKVNKVHAYTSEIKLITTNDVSSKISVVIEDNNSKIYGIMNGYDAHTNSLKVILTSKNVEVRVGSIVKTTGMGGVFPSGIPIGNVIGFEEDTYDVGKIILVEPVAKINELKYLGVLARP